MQIVGGERGKTCLRPSSYSGFTSSYPPQEDAGAGGQGQLWVTGEEPIRDGEWADAGCFRHDSGALGTWELEGGPRAWACPQRQGDMGCWHSSIPPCHSSCHGAPSSLPAPSFSHLLVKSPMIGFPTLSVLLSLSGGFSLQSCFLFSLLNILVCCDVTKAGDSMGTRACCGHQRWLLHPPRSGHRDEVTGRERRAVVWIQERR